MIYILTGDTEIGKSYTLNKWIEGKRNVAGLLSLINDEGKRSFLNVRTKETFMMHAEDDEPEDNKIYVGRYTFLNSAFVKANKIIQIEGESTDFKYLIVDELGRLELKQEGLYNSTIGLIERFETNANRHLILVIRQSLLEVLVELYQIRPYKLINKTNLFSI